MNEQHDLCSTPGWAAWLQSDVLPYLVRDVDLGADMLEVGPGPGAATAWLCSRVQHLVIVEPDEEAAAKLAATYAGTNVQTVVADAAEMEFPEASFDSAGSFTMLHHVPTVARQNALLAEVWRVLRPGGVLIGSDSLPSDGLHQFHEGDTYNPLEPASFMLRLQTLGFERLTISVDGTLRFIAYKPADPTS